MYYLLNFLVKTQNYKQFFNCQVYTKNIGTFNQTDLVVTIYNDLQKFNDNQKKKKNKALFYKLMKRKNKHTYLLSLACFKTSIFLTFY